MPQVTMPDGTLVEMPDQLDPALGSRLRAFHTAKLDGSPVNGPVPDGFYAVTGDDGKQTLRKNLGGGDIGKMLGDLPLVGTAMHMTKDAVNLGVKAASGFAGMVGGAPAVEATQRHGVELPQSNDPIMQGLGKVGEFAGHLAKPVDDAVANLPAGPRTAIEGVEEAIPDILSVAGARAVPRGAAKASDILPGGDIEGALKEAGYTSLPRQTADSSAVSRIGASVVGEPPLAQTQTLTNQAVTNRLAKHEAGVAGDAPLSYEALATARANGPGKVYNAAHDALPENLVQDQNLSTELASIGDTTSQLPRSPDVDALKAAMINQPGMTRGQLFANVQQARDRASRFHASDQPDAHAIGDAYSAVADAYEDFIGRQLDANPQSPVSLADFQTARTAFAKNYLAQSALKGQDINAAVYARRHAKNPGEMTGGSRLIAEQQSRFPLSTGFGPQTYAPDGIGASGSIEGGVARNVTGPLIGGGVGALLGGPVGAAAGAGVGHLGSAGVQGLLRRVLGGNPAQAAEQAGRAATSPKLSNFFQPDSEWPVRPEPAPKIAGLLPSPSMINAGGGMTTQNVLNDFLGLTPDVQAAGRAHPGAARDAGLPEPQARGPMQEVPFEGPQDWQALSLEPEGGRPAAPRGQPGDIPLAELLSAGLEHNPAEGLSLGDMVAPPSRGVPFKKDAGMMAGDLELAPEHAWFNKDQPLGDLAGVMSQGVPEDIAARSSPKRPARDINSPRGKLINNASGESAASVEAINRGKMERAEGKQRFMIDPDGKMWPVRGVEAADAKAQKGSIIVQKGVGDTPYTILDRGGLAISHAKGLLNRALAGGEGLTLGDLLGGG